MKKVTTILSIAVMSLFFSTVNAQQAVGIKGGLNIASLSGFEGRDRISGHVGVFLHHTINKNWCFQPELLYSGEGQR
ncbi:MAG TPA: outer membrane beta-barrel protein, partial [Chitinophagaceae bacterium]